MQGCHKPSNCDKGNICEAQLSAIVQGMPIYVMSVQVDFNAVCWDLFWMREDEEKNPDRVSIENSRQFCLWAVSRVCLLRSMLTGWPLTSHLNRNPLPRLWGSRRDHARMPETLAPRQVGVNVRLNMQICQEACVWAPNFAQMVHINHYWDFLLRKWG